MFLSSATIVRTDMCVRVSLWGRLWVADHVNCLVKVKFRTIFSTVAGAADLLDNAAWTFTPQTDDIAVSLGLRLLHMTLSRTMTGFTLHS